MRIWQRVSFIKKYEEKYVKEGDSWEITFPGMMKADGFPMLHFSPDGIIKHTHAETGVVTYHLREGKCPWRLRNHDVLPEDAVREYLLPKLLPSAGNHSRHDERLPPCATGNKARDRFRGRIHRSHYAQIQYSAYLFELATDCRVADILYDVTLIPDSGGDAKTAILRIPVDRVYGRWLVEEAKKLWMKHKSLILDAKRLPFIFQASAKKVARKKRLTKRHGSGGRKKKDKKSDTSETKAMDIAQTTEPTPAVNKTETRQGKIAKPLSQSGWTEDERERYKKEQELLPDDFDVDRTRVCKLNALGVSTGGKQQFSELSALVGRAQGILCLTMNHMLQSVPFFDPTFTSDWRELLLMLRGKQPRGKRVRLKQSFGNKCPADDTKLTTWITIWQTYVEPYCCKYPARVIYQVFNYMEKRYQESV